MCCFSQAVDRVSDTNIFGRGVNGRQFLVYEMSYAADADLAMVLPLPVPLGVSEGAVRFINLEKYPDFFTHLRLAFPQLIGRSKSAPAAMSTADAPLKIHSVGKFEASFVPGIADFDRLDRRFRIPRHIWDQLPTYRDYGFAVFKLKGTASGGLLDRARRLIRGREPAPVSRVHPMALEFPRRNPDLLYFPTVHIHHQKVEPQAQFDHTLFWQTDSPLENQVFGSLQSKSPLGRFMDLERTEGLINPEAYGWKAPLHGILENKDSWIGSGGTVPQRIAAK